MSSLPIASRRLVFLGLLVLCGCGDGEVRPPLHPVNGKLTINGKPAAGALLIFHPAKGIEFDSRGSRPRAKVSQDGTFQVTTYQNGDGAPAGDYQVGILWFDNPDSNNPWDKLGNRYANPEKSEIRVSVEEGNNLLMPIEIENVQIMSRPTQGRDPQDLDQVD